MSCSEDCSGGPHRPGGGRGVRLVINGEGCCHGRSVPVEGFAVPCLLLLLSEKPAHGYELIERLGVEFGLGELDPAGVYRNLKRMEEDGLLESEWETSGSGPARKTYRVTADGRELLDLWAKAIARDKRALEAFLERYERSRASERG